MAYLIGLPLLALLAILQSVIFSEVTLIDGRPDLILLAVIGWGIAGQTRESMVFALFGGLFLDAFSGLPLGTSAIMLILIAFLVSFSEGRFWEAHLLMPIGVTLITSLLFHVLMMGVLLLVGKVPDPSIALFRIILPSTFLNIILALPAVQVAESINNFVHPPAVSR
jgi:rod shape-determining protein MreD